MQNAILAILAGGVFVGVSLGLIAQHNRERRASLTQRELDEEDDDVDRLTQEW